MKKRYVVLAVATIGVATVMATSAAARPTPPDGPTFGALSDAAMNALRERSNHPPRLLTPQALDQIAEEFEDFKARADIPDYLSVLGPDGEIVGYVDSESVLNPYRDLPASPAETATWEPKPTEVVDRDLNVIGHFGQGGFTPLD